MNDAKDVELLTLVLVDPLDLDVEEGFWVHFDPRGVENVLGQADLVGVFDLLPLFSELLVVRKGLKLVEKGEISQELVATDLRGDQLRQTWISLMQPAPRRDAIGDVGEFVRPVDCHEILENRGSDQIRVQLGHTIDFVTANGCKVGHSHHLGLGLLDDRYTTKHVAVFGEATLNHLQEFHVDVVDDLEMSWEQILHQWDGPLLQSFRHDSVIRVAERLGDDAPGFIPFKAFQIYQNTLHFNNGQSRVGIVELNGNIIRECRPCLLGLLEAAHDIIQRGSTPEVLLLQAKLLSALEVIVGVQDSRDGLRTLLLCYRAFVLSVIEFLEVKFA